MSRYRRMPLSKLIVDKAYQRPLDMPRVNAIAENFDPALLGTLEVSVRNGKAAVFDGQHRLAALKKLKHDDAPCLVHEGLGVPEEAMLFVQLQTQRRSLKAIDRFKARLTAGEEQATVISQVASDHGYVIADNSHDNTIGAVTALDRVYDRGGPRLLEAALELLTIWKGEPKGTDGALIEGLAIAIHRHGTDPRWATAATALENVTAGSVLRKAIASLESGGGSASRPHAVAKQVARLVGIRGSYKKRSKVTA